MVPIPGHLITNNQILLTTSVKDLLVLKMLDEQALKIEIATRSYLLTAIVQVSSIEYPVFIVNPNYSISPNASTNSCDVSCASKAF